jgi:hypothetical protein
MRHPPTIALVALWPKQWSMYRDLSFKIRGLRYVVVGGPPHSARNMMSLRKDTSDDAITM